MSYSDVGTSIPIIHCTIIGLRPTIDYMHLRKIQNRDWALHHVAEGIEYAEKNETSEAVKKYQAALELDPDCVEALVARGAM